MFVQVRIAPTDRSITALRRPAAAEIVLYSRTNTANRVRLWSLLSGQAVSSDATRLGQSRRVVSGSLVVRIRALLLRNVAIL